jgi:hypothetical protein
MRTATSEWPYDIVAEKSPYTRSLNTNAAKASPGDAFDSDPNMRRITNESSLFRNHEPLHTQSSRAVRKLVAILPEKANGDNQSYRDYKDVCKHWR